MSQGIQLISAVLAARSHTAARRLRADLFTPEETPMFEFVHGFYRRYGQLPTPEAVTENGFRTMIAPNPVDYYYDRVCNRNIGVAWQAEHPNLVRALSSANVPDGQATLERMVRIGRRFDANNTVVSMADAAQMVREDYEFAAGLLDELRGITFGWDYLDAMTGGATRGDVSAFVARPGMGKSWTMIYQALRAWQAGASVLFVTMEMTVLQTMRRMIGMISGINSSDIRRGRLSMWGEQIFYETLDDRLHGAPFHFVAGDLNKSVLDVDNLVMEFSPDLVIVDAAYLLEPETNKNSRYAGHELLQNVLKGLKGIALRRDVPINISVQFNREASKMKNGNLLENIGGSDWIGQIASNVVAIGAGEPGSASERLVRRYKVIKGRDAERYGEFETNFLFQPFNMDFVREIVEGQQASVNQAEMARLNASMI